MVVIVINKLCYSILKVFGIIIMLKLNHILHCPVITLDFPLGLWMKWFSSNVGNFFIFQESFQVSR